MRRAIYQTLKKKLSTQSSFAGAYDAIPNIRVAYGLRRMRSAYTGALIRVRRNDATEQDIGYLANGDLNLTALSTFLGTQGHQVITWYDQSGSAYNAVLNGAIAGIVAGNVKSAIRVQSQGNAMAVNGFSIPLVGATMASGSARQHTVWRQIASPTGNLNYIKAGTSFIRGSQDPFRTSTPWEDSNIYDSFMLTARVAGFVGDGGSWLDWACISHRTKAGGVDVYKNNVLRTTLNGTVNTNPTLASFPDATYGSAEVSEFVLTSQSGSMSELAAIDAIQRSYYNI